MKKSKEIIVSLFLVAVISTVWIHIAASTEFSTNFILMCEENEFVDSRLLRNVTELPKNTANTLFEIMNERNNNPKRPFLILKYINKKLSFNSEGVEFLINEFPGESNMIGWLGNIVIKDDKIYFELTNEKEINSSLVTTLTIDRFTGLYKQIKYSLGEGREFPHFESIGKCIKHNERLF